MPVPRAFHFALLCALFALPAPSWAHELPAPGSLDSAYMVRAQSPDRTGYSQAGDRLPSMPYDSMPRPPMQPLPVSRPVDWPGTPVNSGVVATSYTASPQPTGMNPPPFAPPPLGAQPMVQNNVAVPAQQTAPIGPAPQALQYGPAPQAPSIGPQQQAPLIGPAPAMPSFQPVGQMPQQGAPVYMAGQMPAQPPAQQSAPDQASALPIPAMQAPPAQVQPAQAPSAQQVAPAQAPPPQTPGLSAPNVQIFPSTPQELSEANIVARVGTEVVLAGDIRAMVSDMLAQKKIEVTPEQREEAVGQAGRQILKQIIESKLVYNDAVHTVPATNFGAIESKINEVFDTTQLPELMKTNGVTTRQELDTKLRERGSSLDRMRRSFFERTLSSQWLRQGIKMDEEVPVSEILSYYQQHQADYEFPAKVRWEELMVRFDRFPDKQAAYAALAAMGNDVMRGVPLESVAKGASHGTTAEQGGKYDWTTKGSLVAKNIDEAIFSLPLGSMSPILETPQGFHVVRVLERKDAGRTPFTDAQGEIKKKLKDEKLKNQIERYLDELRKRTPVWTIYDDQPGGLDGIPPKS